jgi:signal peptidase I
MRPRRIRKLLSTALVLLVLGAAWFYLAPVQLGGSTTYVVTHGVSMEPRFHTGDLAIVRSKSSYHVGEIVAYHNNMLHTIVLHRIIGHEGDRYIFKGDNNDFIDPEHPLASQLIGALWVHIPGAGVRLQSIRSPAVMGGLIFVGILLLTGGAFTQRRGRRRRQQRVGASIAESSPHLPQHPGNPVVGVLAFGLLALVPFVALALLAFTRPPTTHRQVKIPYKQSGTLSYSADAAPGPAYPSGHATTGEPLFTDVLRAVDVRFGYQFESDAKHALTGKASLSETITSTSGWHRTLALGAPTHFRGDHGSVAGTLDLGSLVALIDSVEATTKVHGIYALTITPRVSAHGTVGPAPLEATFAPEIKFSIVEGEVKPEGTAESPGARGSAGTGSSSSTGSSAPSQFAPSSSGSVAGAQNEPTSLPLGIVQPSVATARAIALGAIALIIATALAILALLRPILARRVPRRGDEATSILARYRGMIVPVARVWPLPGVPVIDVVDIDALVQIAEHYERSILHETDAKGDAFWVSDESGQFRYTVDRAANAVEQQVAQQIPHDLPVTAVLDIQPVAEAVADASDAGYEWAHNTTVYDSPVDEPMAYDAAPPQPATYEPAAYEPAPPQPAIYEPAAYEPAPPQPAIYEPAAYEPAPPQPAIYEPAAYAPEPVAYDARSPQPVYEQPAYQPPASYNAPAHHPVASQPGAFELSAYDQATYQPAAYRLPAEDPAEAVTQDWPSVDDGGDVGRTPAMAAFAPITGSDWT